MMTWQHDLLLSVTRTSRSSTGYRLVRGFICPIILLVSEKLPTFLESRETSLIFSFFFRMLFGFV